MAKRAPAEMLPGMPDRLAKRPPKATDDAWMARTLDEAVERTHQILATAKARYSTDGKQIVGTYLLYSGGNDSVIPLHLLRDHVDGIVHVNTGTAIPATTAHVREVAAAWELPLHELHPRDAYRDLVMGRVLARTGANVGRPVWKGFPGPGGDSHRVMYRRLKDEPLQSFRASLVGREGARKKVLYVAGMRWDESEPRFRNAEEIDPDGAIIWVSPVVHWTNAHMQEYRRRHRCAQLHEHAPHHLCTPDALPLNEVAAALHMSGDCTCGCFAKPGEKEEIRFFYPDKAAEIDALEREVEAAGIAACRWGERPPGTGPQAREDIKGLRLCSGCPTELAGQAELFAEPVRVPKPSRPAVETPYRMAQGTVWVRCPLCIAHDRNALVLSGRHLVYRGHDLTTYGGARVPCAASGVAVCDLAPKAWLTTDPIGCPHDA